MKILAYIPTSEIKTQYTSQHQCEVLEVEVVAIHRIPAEKKFPARRWHYEATVKPHAKQLPSSIYANLLYRVNVIRSLNPKWKKPEFPSSESRAVIIYSD